MVRCDYKPFVEQKNENWNGNEIGCNCHKVQTFGTIYGTWLDNTSFCNHFESPGWKKNKLWHFFKLDKFKHNLAHFRGLFKLFITDCVVEVYETLSKYLSAVNISSITPPLSFSLPLFFSLSNTHMNFLSHNFLTIWYICTCGQLLQFTDVIIYCPLLNLTYLENMTMLRKTRLDRTIVKECVRCYGGIVK
jgi:hypothetical protein